MRDHPDDNPDSWNQRALRASHNKESFPCPICLKWTKDYQPLMIKTVNWGSSIYDGGCKDCSKQQTKEVLLKMTGRS